MTTYCFVSRSSSPISSGNASPAASRDEVQQALFIIIINIIIIISTIVLFVVLSISKYSNVTYNEMHVCVLNANFWHLVWFAEH